MNNQIEIKIESQRLPLEKFQRAVEEFFGLLKGVTKNISGESKPEDWSVGVESGSAIIRALTESPTKALAIDAISRGLKSLGSGVQIMPLHFTKEEVKAARSLAALIDDDRKFVSSIWIKNGDDPIILNREIVNTADLILSGEKQIAFGSIEGTIEILIRKENQPFESEIKDPIYGRRIKCSFLTPEAEEEAYKAFRPPRRVLVSGLIHYAKEGHPLRIDANIVWVFPNENELPTLEDIHRFFE